MWSDMTVQGGFPVIWVVLATALPVMTTRGDPCNQVINLGKRQMMHFVVNHTVTSSHECVIEIRTVSRWRVVLNFDYKPALTDHSPPDDCSDQADYLLVGNDFTAVGEELLTSYKFCQHSSRTEIVSRDNYLWLTLRSSSRHAQLLVNITTLPAVTCSPTQRQCSPVQCVEEIAVCDGQTDCDNGLDEYCYNFTSVRHEWTASPESLEVKERQLLPPEDSACFLCRDGTCILPRVSRYDRRWGEELWYLCDGLAHCPDGWDEDEYSCYLRQQVTMQQARPSLFQCEAYDTPEQVSRQVRLWTTARCDARRDCRLPRHETCVGRMSNSRTGWDQLYLDPGALTIVLIFVMVVLAGFFYVLRQMGHPRPVGPGRHHGGSVDLADDSSEELNSCLPAGTLIMAVTQREFQRLPETFV